RSSRPRPSTTTPTSSPRSRAGSARRWSASTSTTSRCRTAWPSAAGDRPPGAHHRPSPGRRRTADACMSEAAGAPSSLGPDWVLGDDGLYFRRGARVLLLDDADRLLLVRGHDLGQPARSWWLTGGGGVDPGESDLDAAVREVREETGIVLDPATVVGPVYTR